MLKKCLIENCNRRHHAKGVCKKHYAITIYNDEKSTELRKLRVKRHRQTLKCKFSEGRRDSKKRGISWELSFDEFCNLRNSAKDFCYYCNNPIISNGYALDRINNSEGYSKANCVVCCSTCNRFKTDLINGTEMKAVVDLLKYLRNNSNIWNSK